MPTYEYTCKACGHIFDLTTTLREHIKSHKPACPKCKSHKVESRPTAFQAVTSAKA